MSNPKHPGMATLVMGVLYADAAVGAAALDRCVAEMGPVDSRLGPVPFSWSSYYQDEMGPDLKREWLVFRRRVDPELLAELKLFTNAVESAFSESGRRMVNLDPGILTRWNLVLATGKPRHQRVYLRKGIFGDLTLVYHTGAYHGMPWTYPDWGSEQVRAFLGQARAQLLREAGACASQDPRGEVE